ncbi:MAG: hypothetical protein R3F60_06675 [bacterium]
MLRRVRGLTDRPIIAVGGIGQPEDAAEALAEGATLVQVYTGFIYGGPDTARRLCAGLPK